MVIVPPFVPELPEVIVAQDWLELAVQFKVPLPPLATLNAVEPAFPFTETLPGDTLSAAEAPGACLNVTVLGLPAAPEEGTVIVAVRL